MPLLSMTCAYPEASDSKFFSESALTYVRQGPNDVHNGQ